MSIGGQDLDGIPVLGISTSDRQVGKQLVDAATRYGFIYIRNYGTDIPPAEIDRAFELSRDFFSLPSEEKNRFHITPNNRGWSSAHSEILDHGNQRKGDYKEAFNVGEFKNGKAQQPLPSSLQAHEAEVNHFANRCHNLCLKLLRLFALGLEIDEQEGGQEWFSSRHDPSKGPSGTILRFLYYPSITAGSEQHDEVRAGAHSDYGSITLLFQRPSQPGLEILTPSSTWSPVPVYPRGTESDSSPPLLVNIGDLLSYWTNGLLKSTVHRVLIPAKTGVSGSAGMDRYSIAYFCHPVDQTPLVPVPSEKVRAAARAKDELSAGGGGDGVLTAEEHLKKRLAATYGWDTENDK